MENSLYETRRICCSSLSSETKPLELPASAALCSQNLFKVNTAAVLRFSLLLHELAEDQEAELNPGSGLNVVLQGSASWP